MSGSEELKALREQREQGIRELGFAAVDMYGRGEIDVEALRSQAGGLAAIDEQMRDLEARLRLAT